MFHFHKFYEDGRLNKDLIFLLLIGLVFTLAIALSNSFVNVYVWKQTKSFVVIGVYNLATSVLQPLTFILAGRLAKRIDRAWILRLGVIFLALFFVAVLLSGTHASRYIFLLGGCLGVGYGFYWLAYNVLTFEITEPHTRDIFNGFLGILSSFSGMIGPIVAGYIISRNVGDEGYMIVFGLSFFLFIIGIGCSFFLSKREMIGEYGFRVIWKELKANVAWRNICYAHVTQGLREGVFIFLISMYVYLVTGSELALGKFGLISSGISFVGYYIVSHFLKEHNRKKAILVAGVVMAFAVLILLYHVTYMKLIIYAGIIAVAYPLLSVPFVSMTYDVIGRGYKAREFRIEYIVIREIFLNLGRILGIIIFIFGVMLFPMEKSLPVLLVLLGTGHAWIYFFIKDIRYEPNDEVRNGLEVTESVLHAKDGDG